MRTIELNETIEQSFTWSPSKDAAGRKAKVVFDLSQLSAKDIEAYVVDSLTIKLQGELRRKHGTEKWTEPTKDDEGTELYKVVAPRPGERKSADPVKTEAKKMAAELAGAGLSLEDIQKLIAQVKAVNNEDKPQEEQA